MIRAIDQTRNWVKNVSAEKMDTALFIIIYIKIGIVNVFHISRVFLFFFFVKLESSSKI